MFKHYGDTSKQQYSVLQNVVWMEKPGEDRGESILMCQVNSRLLGFLNFFFLFSNPSRLAVERGKKMISLLVPPATT